MAFIIAAIPKWRRKKNTALELAGNEALTMIAKRRKTAAHHAELKTAIPTATTGVDHAKDATDDDLGHQNPPADDHGVKMETVNVTAIKAKIVNENTDAEDHAKGETLVVDDTATIMKKRNKRTIGRSLSVALLGAAGLCPPRRHRSQSPMARNPRNRKKSPTLGIRGSWQQPQTRWHRQMARQLHSNTTNRPRRANPRHAMTGNSLYSRVEISWTLLT